MNENSTNSNTNKNITTEKTKSAEELFYNNTTEVNIKSWETRDGRKNYNRDDDEILFKEHLENLSRQKSNIQILNSIEFKVNFYSTKTNEIKEINYKKIPLLRFSNFNGMPIQLANNIQKLKYDVLTPIQKLFIPYMQNNKDVVAVAETGSGKTVAYLFPLVGNMLIKGTPKNPYLNNNNFKSKAFPLSLILVPTRELAEQVSKESKKMCFKTGIRTVAVYGGVKKYDQICELRKGVDILIACPGRLIDLIKQNVISLQMVSSFILDEADRMLDMGFSDDINKIVNDYQMPDKFHRQNLLFSATFSDEIKDIAIDFLKDFYYIHPLRQSPKQIVQEIIEINTNFEKNNKLFEIINKNRTNDGISQMILIFVGTKKGVDKLAQDLANKNIKVVSIHGDKDQNTRDNAIKLFSSGKIPILIATDVASRGLDFPNVSFVVNYDMPHNIDDYIHRIGRTGRVGSVGHAISFVGESDSMVFGKLYNFLMKQNQKIPEWFENRVKGNFNNSWNNKGNSNWGNNNNENNENSWNNNNNNNWSNNDNNNNNNSSSWNGNVNNSSWGNNDNNNNNSWNDDKNNNDNNASWDINNIKNNNSWNNNSNSNNNNNSWNNNSKNNSNSNNNNSWNNNLDNNNNSWNNNSNNNNISNSNNNNSWNNNSNSNKNNNSWNNNSDNNNNSWNNNSDNNNNNSWNNNSNSNNNNNSWNNNSNKNNNSWNNNSDNNNSWNNNSNNNNNSWNNNSDNNKSSWDVKENNNNSWNINKSNKKKNERSRDNSPK